MLHHYHNKSTNLGNDGYVAFQVEGDPAPTVEWFKVNSFLNAFEIIRNGKIEYYNEDNPGSSFSLQL